MNGGLSCMDCVSNGFVNEVLPNDSVFVSLRTK